MNLEEAVCSPSHRFGAFTHMEQFESRKEQMPLQRAKVEEVVVIDKEDFTKMENFIASQNYTIDKLCLLVLKKEGKIEEIKTIWRKEREERRRLERIVQTMQQNIAPQIQYSEELDQENRPLQTRLKIVSPREKAERDGYLPKRKEPDLKQDQGRIQLLTQNEFRDNQELQGYESVHKGVMEMKSAGFKERFMLNLEEDGYFDQDQEETEEESSEEYKVLEALAGLGNWKESECKGNSYIEQLKRASREYREAIEKMLEIGRRNATIKKMNAERRRGAPVPSGLDKFMKDNRQIRVELKALLYEDNNKTQSKRKLITWKNLLLKKNQKLLYTFKRLHLLF